MQLTAGMMILACGPAFAQAPLAKPSFEVASIRPGSGRPMPLSPGGVMAIGGSRGGPGSSDPERWTANSITLKSVLQNAYGMKRYQVSGPGFMDTDRYDILAKVPLGASKEDFHLMLQSLLEERFNLKLHHETKEFPAYNLVVAKGGLKLKESVSTDICSAGGHPAGKECPQGAEPKSGIAISAGNGPGSFIMSPAAGGRIATARSAPISALASMMQVQLGGPLVIDKTGLTGTYDIRFEYAPTDVGTQGEFAFPSLFAALEKELGLKLESTKVSVDMLVIDHIDKTPTEN